MTFKEFENWLVTKTEAALSRRRRRRLARRSPARKRKVPTVILEWLITFAVIFIAAVVFQMLVFQNYRIPSESMVPTLLDGDLILVEKITFGPELLPGRLKLPALRSPRHGEIVSFESELYAKNGPLAELADRLVFIATLSLVNLKTDSGGDPIVDLLIKRVIGLPGDRVRQLNGRFEILPACEERWLEERDLMARGGTVYTIEGDYSRRTLPLDRRSLARFLDRLTARVRRETPPVDITRAEWERNPQDSAAASAWLKQELGWYIPAGMFFPMGDNRPQSKDARFYGPVDLHRIQGKSVLRFFPFSRFGAIE
ncbi:MAG: signal peptidase I [Spirochaetales bacterium]|nr:signal peptidase I [Spirochaetales bacterium]